MPISLEDQTSLSIRERRRESEAATSERPLRMPGVSGEVEVEGMTGLALSSSTPMGRLVTYSRICCWQVHRDRRDDAGPRHPSSCAGTPPSLRVHGAGLGTYDANECCVPSTPSYRRSEAFRGGLKGTTSHIRKYRGSARRLGPREGRTACYSRSRASIFASRRDSRATRGSVE